MEEIDLNADLLAWSETRPDWQKDVLRRLATGGALPDDAIDDVLSMIMVQENADTVTPIPFDATHLPGGTDIPPVRLKRIDQISNVNRLDPDAVLEFGVSDSAMLTVVYGENGSGKSGFVRILRRSCRTRIDVREQTTILPDVTEQAPGEASARITILDDQGEEHELQWTESGAAHAQLRGVSVYDVDAARVYVTAGQRIEIEPRPIQLIRGLITTCDAIKIKVQALLADKNSELARHEFDPPLEDGTTALTFVEELSGSTTDEEINQACIFTKENEERLKTLDDMLNGSATAIESMRSLASWLDARSADITSISETLSEKEVPKLLSLMKTRDDARAASGLGAADAFKQELPGTGGEIWRRLYEAAKMYSVEVAYKDQEFPYLGDGARCVWCQQPLDEGLDRLKRFEAFVSDELQRAADSAQLVFTQASKLVEELSDQHPDEFKAWTAQIGSRDEALAKKVSDWWDAALLRLGAVKNIIGTGQQQDVPALVDSPKKQINDLASSLREEAKTRENALSNEGKEELLKEFRELSGTKRLNAAKKQLATIRNTKAEIEKLQTAQGGTDTTGITRKANSLASAAIIERVQNRFAEECDLLQVTAAKLGLDIRTKLRRERDKIVFENTIEDSPGIPLDKILSEGESRALSLAAYLSEVSVVAPGSPLVIDDPVSSLDHVRSAAVAKRLAKEAQERQVIVFTHNLEFFNNLLTEASGLGIEPISAAVFRPAAGKAGKLNPQGGPWKSQSVSKRIRNLRNRLEQHRGLHGTDPNAYEAEIRGLYTSLRETYERFVEEILFYGVITRFKPDIQTLRLRKVTVPHDVATQFHAGYSKANHFSHDNPPGSEVTIPNPDEVAEDIEALKNLVTEQEKHQGEAEKARPSMQPQSHR